MSSSISICIPTYNQGRFVGDALNSVLAQTVAPYEVVVSNNHSTDQTAEVLDQYCDRIRLVKPAHHVGMQENFQFCAEQARGVWLCFVGSDDLVRPDYVERLEQGIRRCRDDDVLIFGGSERVDATGRIMGRRAILSFPRRASGSLAFEKLLDGARLLLDSVAIRRSAFEAVGGFGPKTLVFDWALYLRLSAAGSFLNLRRYLGRKRYWEGSGFGSGRSLSIEDALREVIWIYRTCMEPRFQPGGPMMRARAVAMLRRVLSQEVARALEDGRSIEEIQQLEVMTEYRKVLGPAAGLATLAGEERIRASAGGRSGFPMKRSWPLGAVDKIQGQQLIRQAAAFALGWR